MMGQRVGAGDTPVSGLGLGVPGTNAVTALRPATCVLLARAVLAAGDDDGQEFWARAAADDPAVADWLAVARPAAVDGDLARLLAEGLVAARPEFAAPTAEAEVLLAALAAAADRRRLRGDLARAIADARLEAARELAYGAGHEINNPLANIATRAQALLVGEHDPERRRRLATIVDQAFRARDMIGGLMIFARPPKPQPSDVNVDAVVRPVVDWMRPLAESRRVRLEYSPPPAPVVLHVDAAQVGEALRALAVNAFEAVDDGGHVVVEAAPATGACHVTVADDGRGMDAETARRACDPFFSGREAGRGLGIGLPKARRLVESSGGDLLIESRPGRGTRAVVTLPLACGRE